MSSAQNPSFVMGLFISQPSVFVWGPEACLSNIFVVCVEKAHPASMKEKPYLRQRQLLNFVNAVQRLESALCKLKIAHKWLTYMYERLPGTMLWVVMSDCFMINITLTETPRDLHSNSLVL